MLLFIFLTFVYFACASDNSSYVFFPSNGTCNFVLWFLLLVLSLIFRPQLWVDRNRVVTKLNWVLMLHSCLRLQPQWTKSHLQKTARLIFLLSPSPLICCRWRRITANCWRRFARNWFPLLHGSWVTSARAHIRYRIFDTTSFSLESRD